MDVVKKFFSTPCGGG